MFFTVKNFLLTSGLLIFTLFSFGYFVNFAYAQTDKVDVKPQRIYPGSTYYPLKRFWEKGLELIVFTPGGRVDYNKMLLENRLSELKYVVDNKLLSEIERSSQRFSYQVGTLVDILQELNNPDKKKAISQIYANYTQLLPALRDQFHANSSFWLLIQQNIDTLNIMSNQLKQSPDGPSGKTNI